MPLELLVLLLMLLGVTLYAIFGGADFGAGVWEFNLALRASKRERALINRAIGPVWETNHVWMIFVMVLFWGAFPTAFAAVSRALWLPLSLALIGIVFRGAGFVFRSYGSDDIRQENLWTAVFALASTLAPFFLSASAWAIASGTLPVTADGHFTGDYLTGWISPMSIFGGFFGVGVCAYTASIYLTREAWMDEDRELTRVWRRRALLVGCIMGGFSLGGLAVMRSYAPELWARFLDHALIFIGGSAACGVGSLVLLYLGKFGSAALGSSGTVAFVIWGWGWAQYPILVPPSITVERAKAAEPVLRWMLITLSIGMLLLIPALVLLFVLFKGKRPKKKMDLK